MADNTRNDAGGTDQRHECAPTNSISRSMSRYRRRAPSVTATSNPAQAIQAGSDAPAPPVPALPPSLATTCPPNMAEIQENSTSQNNIEPGPSSPPRRQLRHTDTRRRAPVQTQQDMDVEERNRLLEEQKKQDLRRLEEQLENTRKVSNQAEKVRSPIIDRFVSFARVGKNKETAPVPTTQQTRLGRSVTRRSPPEDAKTPPAHIEPGGKGIVPQTDAPTSAINAGYRYVTVRCRQQALNLPVTPETTSNDIIAEAASRLGGDAEINTTNCVVVEYYGMLGLERRVRRYERIRDIMNSWDGDSQNKLLVEMVDPSANHDDLDVASVPASEEGPPGCELQMYQSNRPGKWNKRWITLLDNGQIVCAKKMNAKLADKDTVSLCHLSDYDIYEPTDLQSKKHIKPPKRFCFAIKSQHKTTLFLNTEKFVQYFCTDDRATAREFRKKVFGWRSWYLVDRHLEIRNRRPSTITRRVDGPSQSQPTYAIGQFDPLIDMSSFEKPLSQLENGGAGHSDQASSTIQKAVQNLGRRLSKRATPASMASPTIPKREGDDGFTGGLLGQQYESRKQALLDMDAKQNQAFVEGPSPVNGRMSPEPPPVPNIDASWFPSALAHSAKQSKEAQTPLLRPTTSVAPNHERRLSLTSTARRPVQCSPPSSRPSTQHVSHHSPPPHTQYNSPLSSSQPSSSSFADRRGPHKPLVDLTPKIPEAPQWSREKKGHGVKPPDGFNHLVDFISVAEGEGRPNGHGDLARRNTVGRPTRSRSLASSSARPLLHDAPPVPSLPHLGQESQGHSRRTAAAPSVRRGGGIGNLEREQQMARRHEQEREYRRREAAYNSVPGRTGTLKVV